MPGANPVRGGFDSHASPPSLVRRLRTGLPVLILILTGIGPATAQTPDPDPGPPPGRVALQSLALPGWGQASNGAWIKAVGFFGAYSGLLAWGISINQDKQDAVGLLNAAPEEEIAFRTAEVTRLRDDRNAKYWLGGLTLLLSMVDAYVDAHLHHFDRRIDAEVGYLPTTEGPLLGIRLTTALEPAPRARGSSAP